MQDSPKRSQKNPTRHVGEIGALFGEDDTQQSARKKTFELPSGSPSAFFTCILRRLVFSKVEVFTWCGNNLNRLYFLHAKTQIQTILSCPDPRLSVHLQDATGELSLLPYLQRICRAAVRIRATRSGVCRECSTDPALQSAFSRRYRLPESPLEASPPSGDGQSSPNRTYASSAT